MFGNTDYHLRRTKFVVYQIAMIFCVVSESLGTAVLSDYTDEQRNLQGRFPDIYIFNNDYVGIASYNIFVGVMIATVFGAGFFFDLFFPERYEPRWVQNLWQGSAIFMCIAGLADAVAYTVIISIRNEVLSDNTPLTESQQEEVMQKIASQADTTPILYRDSGRAIASLVLLWLGLVATFARSVLSHSSTISRTKISQHLHHDHILQICQENRNIKGEARDYERKSFEPCRNTRGSPIMIDICKFEKPNTGSRYGLVLLDRTSDTVLIQPPLNLSARH
jgi:hypothetical protein